MSMPVTTGPGESAALKRIGRALRLLTGPLPHLCGLAAAVRVQVDARVPTMGIFASGRLLANPDFVARLKDNELVFVLAHELLHLALRTHDRARGSDRLEFNYAHDYVINDILRHELGFASIPASGLDMPGARHRSAEDIILEMRRNAELMPTRSRVWDGADVCIRGALTPSTDQLDAGDVLTDARERELFPGEGEQQSERQAEIKRIANRGMTLMAAAQAAQKRGVQSEGSSLLVSARSQNARPAWQSALQRWIESSAPAERSYMRPSRRGAPRDDAVLAGRRRASWMLNIVLDTSGSMIAIIPAALGAIAEFSNEVDLGQIRLMQCDVAVTADDIVAPEELAHYRIGGLGGSDLSPALQALAHDPEVTVALVITDGDVLIPAEPQPYQVLWALPAQNPSFNPPYGRIVLLEGLQT